MELNWSVDMYERWVNERESLMQRANEIASLVHGAHCGVTDFSKDEVTYEYNNSCNCHPETGCGTFPVQYLFMTDEQIHTLETAREQLRKSMAQQEKERQERERKAQAEENEQQLLARLAEKYNYTLKI